MSVCTSHSYIPDSVDKALEQHLQFTDTITGQLIEYMEYKPY